MNATARKALESMIDRLGHDEALHRHLAESGRGCVEPAYLAMCRNAVVLAAAGDWHAPVEMPFGCSLGGRRVVPAWAIVRHHHLRPHVDALRRG